MEGSSPAAAGSAQPRSPALTTRLVPLAAALAVFGVFMARANFLIDDAFISFRYARNWSELGIPAYNPGVEPPVEGYSNFLWVLLLRFAYAAGYPLEIASRVLSVAAAVGCLLVLESLLVRLRLGTLARALALLALGASAPFAVWSTGGLETALFALLLLSTYALQAKSKGNGENLRGVIAGLLAVALAVTRPEGALWAVGCLLCACIARGRGQGRARNLAYGLAFVLGFGAFLAWRLATHGDWLPNTVHAKAGISQDSLARGARYVATYVLLVPGAVLALGGAALARPRGFGAGVAGMLVGGLAYSAAAGGDWMPFFRFLAPVAPFVALAIGLGVDRLPKVFGPLAVGSIAAGALPLYDVSPIPKSLGEALDFRTFHVGYTSEWQRWETGNRNLERFAQIGRAFGQVAQPGESITFGAIGALGWYSDLYIYDRNGLVNREVARQTSDASSRSAGHDKRVPRAWFLDSEPTYYHAIVAEFPIRDTQGPAFRQALKVVANKVFVQDPGEAALKDHCLPQVYLLEETPGIPPNASLIVLRHTQDSAAARAFWGP